MDGAYDEQAADQPFLFYLLLADRIFVVLLFLFLFLAC